MRKLSLFDGKSNQRLIWGLFNCCPLKRPRDQGPSVSICLWEGSSFPYLLTSFRFRSQGSPSPGHHWLKCPRLNVPISTDAIHFLRCEKVRWPDLCQLTIYQHCFRDTHKLSDPLQYVSKTHLWRQLRNLQDNKGTPAFTNSPKRLGAALVHSLGDWCCY